MRRFGSLVLLLAFALPAPAGEERGSGLFASLDRRSDKVFVGKIAEIARQDPGKIFRLRVLEAWKGCEAGEIVPLLVFDQVVHSGDSAAFQAGSELLVYLRKAPARPPFEGYGPGIHVPSAGDASLILLEGSEGAAILEAGKKYRYGKEIPDSSLLADLESGSERVRANALLALSSLPKERLEAHRAPLAAFLPKESASALRAETIGALGKIGSPDSLDPLIDFALNHADGEDSIPLVAQALNQIDAKQAAKNVESRDGAESGIPGARALTLLSRIDSPEAIGGMLRRMRKKNLSPEAQRGFSALQMQSDPSDLRSLIFVGSLDEKKAAAYSLLRWGGNGDHLFVQAQLEVEQDPKMKEFLKKLLRSPFLSFPEIESAP